MTVSLDIFGDFSRLHEYLETFQYFVNYSTILRSIPIYCESFQYLVNYSNSLELFQYFVNHSNIL